MAKKNDLLLQMKSKGFRTPFLTTSKDSEIAIYSQAKDRALQILFCWQSGLRLPNLWKTEK